MPPPKKKNVSTEVVDTKVNDTAATVAIPAVDGLDKALPLQLSPASKIGSISKTYSSNSFSTEGFNWDEFSGELPDTLAEEV